MELANFYSTSTKIRRGSQRPEGPSARDKMSGKRTCELRRPDSEAREAMLTQMYAAVDAVGGEAQAKSLGLPTSASSVPWIVDDGDKLARFARTMLRTSRPGWSARHYHAVLKLWKSAEEAGDKPLMEQCHRAIDWLLTRMTSHTDRLRLELRSEKRRRASRSRKYKAPTA